MIWGLAIGALKGIVGGYFERKKIEAQGKVDITKARVEKQSNLDTYDAKYDVEAQKQMQYSWKDEWVCLVLTGIFLACFFPQTQQHVKVGFEFLKTNTPEWFAICFVGMVFAVFGLRGIFRGINLWKNGK